MMCKKTLRPPTPPLIFIGCFLNLIADIYISDHYKDQTIDTFNAITSSSLQVIVCTFNSPTIPQDLTPAWSTHL